MEEVITLLPLLRGGPSSQVVRWEACTQSPSAPKPPGAPTG